MNWIHWRLQTISPPPILPPPLPVSLYKSELEAQVSLWVNFAAFLRWHLPPAQTFWGQGREEDAADDEVKVTGQSRTDDVFLNKFSVQNSGFYSIKELHFFVFCDLHHCVEPFNLSAMHVLLPVWLLLSLLPLEVQARALSQQNRGPPHR